MIIEPELDAIEIRLAQAESAAEYADDPIVPPALGRQWNEVWRAEIKRLVHMHARQMKGKSND